MCVFCYLNCILNVFDFPLKENENLLLKHLINSILSREMCVCTSNKKTTKVMCIHKHYPRLRLPGGSGLAMDISFKKMMSQTYF